MSLKSTLQSIKKLEFFDTFKHASTYFTGTMATHALGIITLPFFTFYFSPEDYGIANVFVSLISVIAVLLSLNVHWGIQRYYFEEKGDFDTFLGTVFIALNLIYWSLGGFLLWQSDKVAQGLNLPLNLMIWLILMGYFSILYTVFNQIMVATKQSKKFSALQIISQYSKFGLTLIAVLYLVQIEFAQVYMGKIIAEAAVMLLVASYTTVQIFKFISFKRFSFTYIKYAFVYGIPLIPFALSNYILTSFDQWFINVSEGHSDAGLYSFAYKIGMIYMGLGMALNNGSTANYYKFMKQKAYNKVANQVNSMSKLLVLGGGFLILFAIDIGTLLSAKDDFLAALPIAPVIIGGYLFYSISIFYNRGIFYIKKNIYLSIIILASGLLNVFLNMYFIPLYGYQAAAYTTLFSYIIMMFLSVITTTYILKLPTLPLGNILKYIAFLAIMVTLNYTFGRPNEGLHFGWILYKMCLFGLLGVALFYNKIGLIFNKNNS